jgi:hypothetical protein
MNDDLYKFSVNDLGDYLLTSNSIRSNNDISLISMVLQDSRNYYQKIRNVYPNFKFNHYNKYATKNKNNNTLYNQSKEIYKLLPNFYFNDEQNFKIPSNLLEKNDIEVQSLCMEYIEKCGVVEMELEKSLSKSSIIYDYIQNNIYLRDKIIYLLDKIKIIKKDGDKLKKSFLTNSVKLISIGGKEKNLKKVKDIAEDINKIRILFDYINTLSSDFENYYTEKKNTLFKIKHILKNIKQYDLKIIENFENEFKILNNYSSSLIKNFEIILKEIKDKIIIFDMETYVEDNSLVDHVSIK